MKWRRNRDTGKAEIVFEQSAEDEALNDVIRALLSRRESWDLEGSMERDPYGNPKWYRLTVNSQILIGPKHAWVVQRVAAKKDSTQAD